MKLVALVRRPPDPAAAVAVLAEVSGLTLAEARMRLAPEPPALLARLPDETAAALVTRLRSAGLAALAIDEHASRATSRLIVRAVAFEATQLRCSARGGETLEVPWEDVTAIIAAQTTVESRSEHTEKSSRFDVGAAVISGGLKMTRSVESTVRSVSTDTERLITVFARDGRGATLREGAVDFSCLGPAMAPVRTTNMLTLIRLLRERAPGAYFDDRLVRLGGRSLPFVLGETRTEGGGVSQVRKSSASSVDLLTEVLRRAVEERLLP